MSITTNAELKTAIANWLGRSDQTSRIAEYIALCEADFKMRARLREMETVDAALTINAETVTAPTGILNIKSIFIDTSPRRYLDQMSPSQRRILAMGESGKPGYYCLLGTKIAFDKVPDESYSGKISYGAAFTALSADGDTNHILTEYPNVYLFGALTMAVSRLGSNRSAAQGWPTQYYEAIDALKKSKYSDRYSGGPLERIPEVAP